MWSVFTLLSTILYFPFFSTENLNTVASSEDTSEISIKFLYGRSIAFSAMELSMISDCTSRSLSSLLKASASLFGSGSVSSSESSEVFSSCSSGSESSSVSSSNARSESASCSGSCTASGASSCSVCGASASAETASPSSWLSAPSENSCMFSTGSEEKSAPLATSAELSTLVATIAAVSSHATFFLFIFSSFITGI